MLSNNFWINLSIIKTSQGNIVFHINISLQHYQVIIF